MLLPDPDGPTTSRHCPGLDVDATSRSAGRRRAGVRERRRPSATMPAGSGEGGVAQAGKPSRTPLRRSAFTSPVATSGRIRSARDRHEHGDRGERGRVVRRVVDDPVVDERGGRARERRERDDRQRPVPVAERERTRAPPRRPGRSRTAACRRPTGCRAAPTRRPRPSRRTAPRRACGRSAGARIAGQSQTP